MIHLKDIKKGIYLTGVVPNQKTYIQSVEDFENAVEIIGVNDDGSRVNMLIYESELHQYKLADNHLVWSFTANADDYRLYSEAYRIKLAWLFDPMSAVRTASIEPLPHQITAVYDAMLTRQPLRFILADDPGAGKTIMTGLLIKELMLRGDIKRCLIVSPGSLTEQWQEELSQKFHLSFKILTQECIKASMGNAFDDMPFCIARLDKLARNEDILKILENSTWDLIVCDEAHKMSASWSNGDLKKTRRFQLGEKLSQLTRHFLLLTATPHNGKNDEFELFLSLIDAERYAPVKSVQRSHTSDAPDYSDIMRRLVKEELVRFDGTPLFPERIAQTINYDLSEQELELYEAVTEYVREEFNRAERVTGKRFNTVGFALTILQRRLASSPAAIHWSLKRRLEKLEKKYKDILAGKGTFLKAKEISHEDWDDIDEMDAEESEKHEEDLIDKSTAATSVEELKNEIETLKNLERMANTVRRSDQDRKWRELSSLLDKDRCMFEENSNMERHKLIIFTEHRDTLNYLQDKVGCQIGVNRVVTIHGGMGRDERHRMEADFKHNPEIVVLIATDAAGEGINLQRAHLMINYDLPWNPNRLEQRFGRIHRIGQRNTCYLWNLVANNTREGAVFARLFQKLEIEREQLGGKVFDILGRLTFENKPLRELLIEAIQYNASEEARAHFNRVIDGALDSEKIRQLLEERALSADEFGISQVNQIRAQMERMEARKLQPYFISSFFFSAFEKLGGRYRRRGKRWALEYVPSRIREEGKLLNAVESIASKYEYVCFDKNDKSIESLPDAYLICPGTALLDAVVSLILEKGLESFKTGTIFIDRQNKYDDLKLLLYIEIFLQNDVKRVYGNEIIYKKVIYLLCGANGEVYQAGDAPYLDYDTPDEEEKTTILSYLETQDWLSKEIEKKARNYVIRNLMQTQLEEIRQKHEIRAERMKKEVRSRLTKAINYWDSRANEHEEKARLGKRNAIQNAANARHKADDLRNRLSQRLDEIQREMTVRPCSPKIIGGAIVISQNQVNALMHREILSDTESRDKKTMEMIGMRAVMDIERRLGFEPSDVSAENRGYDIESSRLSVDGDIMGLRFIEVKARKADAVDVTLTKNEILTARNCEERNNYILAIVLVDGEKTKVTYYHRLQLKAPDDSTRSINYNIDDLEQNGQREDMF